MKERELRKHATCALCGKGIIASGLPLFLAGEPCAYPGCDCGLPAIDGQEQELDGYQTAGEAARGHMAMCEKYAGEEP